jgi:ABC-type Na+ efflux pump permease subunit
MKSQVTPFVVAGRILAVIGMGLTAAMAILLALIPAWEWATLAVAAFLPFFGLIVLVERYSVSHGLIGPETPAPHE